MLGVKLSQEQLPNRANDDFAVEARSRFAVEDITELLRRGFGVSNKHLSSIVVSIASTSFLVDLTISRGPLKVKSVPDTSGELDVSRTNFDMQLCDVSTGEGPACLRFLAS
jgi:hypothetical protein